MAAPTEKKIQQLYREGDYTYCLKCIRWAVALGSFKQNMLNTLAQITLTSKSFAIREEGTSILEFIASISTEEDLEKYLPSNIDDNDDSEYEEDMFWSTFCKVIMKCLDTPAKGPVKKRKKRSQEWPKGNANAVLRYYVTLMKKHIRTAALISGTGTVEHREHFLTFLELFQKVGAQNFDGEIYLGTVFEALGLIAPSFESFSSELTTSVTGLLKALPFTSQMGFIQGLPDGVCKLRVLDALICAHTDRTLTPFNRGNKKWKSLLKEPPSYGKLEECIFALRPSYLSHDLLNWLAFVTTNYAKLLALTSQEGLDTPSPTVKCAAMAYTDNIFSWWKDSSTEYGDVDNAAVPLAASVTFPMLHTLV